MKHHGMIFNAEMVRAILDGRKTQTRRMVKPQPQPKGSWITEGEKDATMSVIWCEVPDIERVCGKKPVWHKAESPIRVGDIIWVRETFEVVRETCSYECEEYDVFPWEPDLYGHPKESLRPKCPRGGHRSLVLYKADEEEAVERWEPSSRMPRWASRIDLEVTAVRVERVQDISEEDALKEGIIESELGRSASRALATYKSQNLAPAVLQFADLWQSIYANWDANPFVWVFEFRRVK